MTGSRVVFSWFGTDQPPPGPPDTMNSKTPLT